VWQGPAGTEIDLVVWERGCGVTLACGTGACATWWRLPGRPGRTDQEIPVHLPGGTLFIRVASQPAPEGSPSYSGVSMRGPARIVFEAEIDPDISTSLPESCKRAREYAECSLHLPDSCRVRVYQQSDRVKSEELVDDHGNSP